MMGVQAQIIYSHLARKYVRLNTTRAECIIDVVI